MTDVRRGELLEVHTPEDVAAALREAGGRLTATRWAVVEALFAAEAPVSAEQIAEGVGGRRLDLASVYRTLERLEELGIVRHLHLGHGAGVYGLARGERDYLVCERCGRVNEVDSSKLEPARADIRKITGYEPRFSHFPIHGMCETCRNNPAESANIELL